MGQFVRKITVCLLVATSIASASNSIRIEGADFDFGLVPPNTTVVHRVWIHPEGVDTLRLVDIKPGCGCLSSSWTETPIIPGDSLAIVFYWQTRGFDSAKSVSAYLFLEPDPFPIEIRMQGKVVTASSDDASLTWTPANIVLKESPDQYMSAAFQMTNKTEGDLTLKLVETGPEISVTLPETIGSGQPVRGQVEFSKPDTARSFESSLTFEMAGNQATTFRVTIPIACGDFSFRPVFTTKEK